MARMHFTGLCTLLLLSAGELSAQDPKLALSPSSGKAGTILAVAVLSPPLDGEGASITFEPAGALTVSSLQVLNQQLHFTIAIETNSRPGPYTLVYARPAAGDAVAPLRFDNAFTVLEPPKAVRVRVHDIKPSKVIAGGPPVNVTITGTGFQPGAKVAFVGGGILAATTSVTSETLTATLTVDSSARIGSHPFMIQSPDGPSIVEQSPLPIVEVLPPPPL